LRFLTVITVYLGPNPGFKITVYLQVEYFKTVWCIIGTKLL